MARCLVRRLKTSVSSLEKRLGVGRSRGCRGVGQLTLVQLRGQRPACGGESGFRSDAGLASFGSFGADRGRDRARIDARKSLDSVHSLLSLNNLRCFCGWVRLAQTSRWSSVLSSRLAAVGQSCRGPSGGSAGPGTRILHLLQVTQIWLRLALLPVATRAGDWAGSRLSDEPLRFIQFENEWPEVVGAVGFIAGLQEPLGHQFN